MKLLSTIAIVSAALLAQTATAGDVSVSIGVNQPGFYGQINIGNVPQPPQVIYAQPTYVQRPTVEVPPIYLHVPPGHEKHWEKHCAEYNACGRPVYFVREDWYAQHYRGHEHDHDREHEHEHDHDHDRGWGHGDHDDHDDHHDHDHGHGHDRD